MAKRLIETPFPSTAEVARMMGVSRERVRSLEKMLFGDSGETGLPRRQKSELPTGNELHERLRLRVEATPRELA